MGKLAKKTGSLSESKARRALRPPQRTKVVHWLDLLSTYLRNRQVGKDADFLLHDRDA